MTACPKCSKGELHFFIILGENKVKHHTHNRFCDTCSYAENRRGQEIYSQYSHKMHKPEIVENPDEGP